MCPNCRAFITVDDKVCPYCDTKVGPRAVERRSPSAIGVIPTARFTTVVILLINAGFYVATALFGMRMIGSGEMLDIHPEVLRLFGAKSVPDMYVNGEWWRLITAGFLHANLLHVGFNMYILWFLGNLLEPTLGPVRFAALVRAAGARASCRESRGAKSWNEGKSLKRTGQQSFARKQNPERKRRGSV